MAYAGLWGVLVHIRSSGVDRLRPTRVSALLLTFQDLPSAAQLSHMNLRQEGIATWLVLQCLCNYHLTLHTPHCLKNLLEPQFHHTIDTIVCKQEGNKAPLNLGAYLHCCNSNQVSVFIKKPCLYFENLNMHLYTQWLDIFCKVQVFIYRLTVWLVHASRDTTATVNIYHNNGTIRDCRYLREIIATQWWN